jgi:hypothetical protein
MWASPFLRPTYKWIYKKIQGLFLREISEQYQGLKKMIDNISGWGYIPPAPQNGALKGRFEMAVAANIFTSAKVVASPKASKGKTKGKTEHALGGLEELATLDTLIKSLTAVKATYEAEVKAKMKTIFEEDGTETFMGIDGDATASAECRKRASTSTLTIKEIEKLDEFGIEPEMTIITPERFVVNPVHAANSGLLEQVSNALKKVKGLPDDFIMLQAEEAKPVVSEAVFDAATKDADTRKALLDVVAVLAIKPKLGNPDIAKLLVKATKMVA